AAADGPSAPRPPPARARRSVRRAPGRLHRPDPTTAGVPGQAGDAVLPVAAAADGTAADARPPPAPRRPDARRRPGGVAVPRGAAGGQLGVAGGTAPGPVHDRQPGGRAGRAAGAVAGGAERPGPT